MEPDTTYLPPRDLTAERLVLGALITYPEQIPICLGICDEADFSLDDHRRIWNALLAYNADCNGAPPPGEACLVSLSYYLGDEKLDVSLPDLLIEGGSYRQSVTYYAARIRELRLAKDAVRASEKLKRDASTTTEKIDAHGILATLEKSLEQLKQKLPVKGHEPITQLTKKVISMLTNTALTAVAYTNIKPLDRMLGGWKAGELVIIAGRPGMGKTQFALNQLHHADTAHVLFVSLEMSKEDIVKRLMAQIGNIPYTSLTQTQWTDKDALLKEICDGVNALPVTVIDERDDVASVEKIEATIEQMRRIDKAPQIVIIDYITYLRSATQRKDGNRNLEIEEIARNLKRLAVRQNVCVIALSQLSRDVETRQNKRPVMRDIRDSGGIEQAADVIIALYREAQYNKTLSAEDARTIELEVLKHRNGESGTVYARFDLSTGLFTDHDEFFSPNYLEQSSTKPRTHKPKGSTAAAYTTQGE